MIVGAGRGGKERGREKECVKAVELPVAAVLACAEGRIWWWQERTSPINSNVYERYMNNGSFWALCDNLFSERC